MGARFSQSIRSLWTTIGLALLLLAVLEGAGRIAFEVIDARKAALVDRLHAVNVYSGQEWIAEYNREQLSTSLGWRPYVYWRRVPYRGRYVNVDEQGLRRTWNSAPALAPGDRKIFMFGGSALWGTGARDEFTIPSLVSKRLNGSGGRRVWVTNLGESGYVSTQEVITLLLELQRGAVPDVVVFYDGFNDAEAAMESGVAGIPQNETHRVAEFNLRERLNVRGFIEETALYRLSRSLVGVRKQPRHGDQALARAVVDVYLRNVQIVDALARQFGFAPVFFWQPSVFDKKRPTAWERLMHRGDSGEFFAEVRQALEQGIRSRNLRNVYDLGSIFNEEDGTVFIDPVHVSEKGNDRIAEELVRVIRGLGQ